LRTSRFGYQQCASGIPRRESLALCRHSPSKPHARPSSVFVDEIHAGCEQGAADNFQGRSAWFTGACFQLMNGHDSYAGRLRQILLAPFKKGSGGATLSRKQHGRKLADEKILCKP